MYGELQFKYDLFMKNRELIATNFSKYSSDMIMLCALVYASQHKVADIEKMKVCQEILNEREILLSEFKGAISLLMITKMALSDNPKNYYNRVKMSYDLLNKDNWLGSAHKVVASMTISDKIEVSMIDEIVKKTEDIYMRMKKEHPYITSEEDISLATMLATTDIDIDEMMYEIEKCYKVLEPKFSSANALQSLTHILALNDEIIVVKCNRVVSLYDELCSRGKKYSNYYEIALIGVLAFLDIPVKDIVDMVCEVDELLKCQKGFNNIGKGKVIRRMYSALLVADTYMPEEEKKEDSAVVSSLAIIIAQEIVLMTILVALNLG